MASQGDVKPKHLAGAAAVLVAMIAWAAHAMVGAGSTKVVGAPRGSSQPAPEVPAPTASTPPPAAPADVAAPPADAERTPSGLATKVITPGKRVDGGGAHPGPTDTVKVAYTGWTTDGKAFDSSIPRGEPASFRVDQLVKGCSEGLERMVVGETRRMWVPAELAYGAAGVPGRIPPDAALTFEMELVGIARGEGDGGGK